MSTVPPGITEISPGVFEWDWFLALGDTALLVATLQADSGRVRLDVFAPSAPAGATILITRTHPSGRIWTVRAAQGDQVFSGAGIFYDDELPISTIGSEPGDENDRTCNYEATILDSDGAVLIVSNIVPIQWQTSSDWLKDPGYPARDMPVIVMPQPTEQYQTSVGVFPVQGRPAPIVVSDVRGAATGQIQVATLDEDSAGLLNLLLSTGNILLLQTPPERGFGNLYIQVTQSEPARPSLIGAEPARIWTLAYQEVDPPITPIATPGATYQTALDLYPLYSDLMAAFPHYIDVIEGLPDTPSVISPTLAWRGA